MSDWGYTIFCDDIRQEVGNKLTLVGTYQGELYFVGSDQVVVPRLCALTVLNFDPRRVPSKVTLTLERDEKVIFAENVIDLSQEAPARTQEAEIKADLDQFLSIRAIFMVAPFVMYEGSLRVRARYDGAELKAGSLRLRRGMQVEG